MTLTGPPGYGILSLIKVSNIWDIVSTGVALCPLLQSNVSNIVSNVCDTLNGIFILLVFLSFEPPRGKTNNVVPEQVRYKPACTSTEKN